MSDTLARVKRVTAEVLKIDPSKIKDNSHFVRDLGAESIQSIELVAAFEEEFSIEMDEDAALSVSTIDGAVKFIDKVMAETK
jgi:acyl carrier protein